MYQSTSQANIQLTIDGTVTKAHDH